MTGMVSLLGLWLAQMLETTEKQGYKICSFANKIHTQIEMVVKLTEGSNDG